MTDFPAELETKAIDVLRKMGLDKIPVHDAAGVITRKVLDAIKDDIIVKRDLADYLKYTIRQQDSSAQPYLWLSAHQCPECCALVVEDYMPDHERWHEEVRTRTTNTRRT